MLDQLAEPKEAGAKRLFQQLHKKGMPTRKEEPYTFLPWTAISEMEVAGVEAMEVEVPDGVIALPLKEAYRQYGALLHNRLATREEADFFALMTLSQAEEGLFIYVPPGMQVTKPVEFKTRGAFPRIHVMVGKGSQIGFVTRAREGVYNASHYYDFALEEGAQVRFEMDVNPDEEAIHFDAVRVSLKRDSHFSSLSLSRGAKCVRQDFHVVHKGENASSCLKGLFDLGGKRHAHAHILMEHDALHTTSNQHFKSVMRDASRMSFEGKIFIHKEAQKTLAYQLSNNLLLSEKAIAHAKPNLEIFADDVKASHGATVGRLDPDQLFYLKSRGVENAEEMLIAAFAQEMYDARRFPLS